MPNNKNGGKGGRGPGDGDGDGAGEGLTGGESGVQDALGQAWESESGAPLGEGVHAYGGTP